jgi:Metalloenzyme superfamily
MFNRIISPPIVRAILTALIALQPLLPAHADAALKTRNVVLIVSDGVRWQEVFTGADATLLNEKDGGIWDKEEDLRREFWRPDASERRKALFPFLWNTVAAHGQIFGNQARGSIARVTNGLAFSYPGYNEMLTGHPDARINSNEFGPNPNISVFEWLNTLPDLHGRVSVFATWATFKDIFNVRRSQLPLHVGWDLPYQGPLSPRQELLNQLYQTTTRMDDEDVYDAFLQIPLLDSVAKDQPRVLFVGYGETDNWGHAGRYDLVLHSAHLFDHFVEQLWNTLQRLPAYRDQTTFIITTDHGRGSGPVEWKEHGVEQKGSENIWIAVLGPDTPPLGERSQVAEVHQAQIAATVAALLGKDYRKAVPAAAAPIVEILGKGASTGSR